MILGRDFHLSGQKIFHRMVRTMMAESQLECFSPERKPAKLVTQANTEHGNAAQQIADRLDRIRRGFGVSGPVRKKNSIGLERHRVFRRGLRRNDDNIAIAIHQEAKDILFDSEVIRDDTESPGLAVRLRLNLRFLPWGSREFNGAPVPS